MIKIYLYINGVFWKAIYIRERVPVIRIAAHREKRYRKVFLGQPLFMADNVDDIAEFRGGGVNDWKYNCYGDFYADEKQRLIAC